MANEDIRKYAKARGVYLWEIADKLGIHDTAFSKALRYELAQKEKEKIIAHIKQIAANKADEEKEAKDMLTDIFLRR